MAVYQSEFQGATIDARLAAVATMQTAISNLETAVAAKYSKPASGIPETDLDASVQAALALARTAVQSLSDYYTKAQVDDITAAIAASVDSTSGVVVTTLPSAGAGTLGKIYYVGPDANGFYDRYVTSYDGSTYSWLALGNTEVDMTQYATVVQLSQLDQELTIGDTIFTAASVSGSLYIPELTAGQTYAVKFTLSAAKTMSISIRSANGSSAAVAQQICTSKPFAQGENILAFVRNSTAGRYFRFDNSGDWSAISNVEIINTIPHSTVNQTLKESQTILNASIPSFTKTAGSYINASGSETSNTAYALTSPISVPQGMAVIVRCYAGASNVSPIAQKKSDNSYKPLVVSASSEIVNYRWDNLTDAAINVVISYRMVDGLRVFIAPAIEDNRVADIEEKINGVSITSETITADANTDLQKSIPLVLHSGKWTILTHSDFGVGQLGGCYFRDANNTSILYKGITFGTPLEVTLDSDITNVLLYLRSSRVGSGGSLYLTATIEGLTEVADDVKDIEHTLSAMATDNLFVGTAGTQTVQEVTCTQAQDGTYLLNGTAAEYGYIWLNDSARIPVKQGEKYAICGKDVNSPRYSLAYKLYKNGVQLSANTIDANSVLTIGDADELTVGVSVVKNIVYSDAPVNLMVVSAYSATYPLYLQRIAAVKKNPRPMLTIIDDDGMLKFKTLLLPVITGKKVPIATAIIGSHVGQQSSMTWEDIADCMTAGAEIMSHSYSHVTETAAESMTQEEVQYDYQIMQNLLKLHGATGDGLVFAGNSSNIAKCKAACKNVYDYGFKASANQTNYVDTIDRYGIYRYGVLPGTDDLETLLDGLAAAGTGWMVWMTHTSDSNFQQASATALADAIDYARSLGVDIVSAATGVAYYLNGRD